VRAKSVRVIPIAGGAREEKFRNSSIRVEAAVESAREWRVCSSARNLASLAANFRREHR
jgi:hypothetical protein